MIYNSFETLVGKTPLVKLNRYMKENDIEATILAKLEYFNPAGSVKDRIAKNMIEDYENKGILKEGSVIIEPTSGNTGIGIAAMCASKGYKAILVMPETMSKERRSLLKAYGAELVLTEGKLGMKGAIAKAQSLKDSMPNSILAGQFVNPSNPEVHYKTTGPEIWEDSLGNVDIFVSAIGTGGTVSGCGKYLKEKNDKIKVVGVEPQESPFLTEGKAGPHKIQGIGAGFEPETLSKEICDEIMCVSFEEALHTAREVAKKEGYFVGISSGAALSVAERIAKLPQNKNKTIVVILPDTGERYLSSGIVEEE